MKVIVTAISDVLLLEPAVHADARGFFFESYNARLFAEAVGSTPEFVQDNHSSSGRGVLRGLHYQIRQPQGKLIRVLAGEIFDVAVDIRRGSPTYARWVGATLSAHNKHMLWVPPGFAHGFYVISDHAEVAYKATDYWAPGYERCVAWNDPDLGIAWPLAGAPLLSDKDRSGVLLAQAEIFA